jgi:hypothetical protein
MYRFLRPGHQNLLARLDDARQPGISPAAGREKLHLVLIGYSADIYTTFGWIIFEWIIAIRYISIIPNPVPASVKAGDAIDKCYL